MRDLRGMNKNKKRNVAEQTPQQTLRGPAREERDQAELARQASKQLGGNDMKAIEQAVEKYGAKSDGELMNELMDFKRQGQIDDAQLAQVAARLAPMLNEQQKKRLESVLGSLQKTMS